MEERTAKLNQKSIENATALRIKLGVPPMDMLRPVICNTANSTIATADQTSKIGSEPTEMSYFPLPEDPEKPICSD